MIKKRTRKKSMSEINVVPYIDVMLVLLIIFMITTPLLTQGVKIDLPKAAAQGISTEQQQPVIVTVDKAGQYYLNVYHEPETAIEPEVLATRVAAEVQLAIQRGNKREVLVKGDQSVEYGKVIQAMVLLQHAGVENVGLMTDPPAEPQNLLNRLQPNK